jgi:sugar lactone lactonase YvrE
MSAFTQGDEIYFRGERVGVSTAKGWTLSTATSPRGLASSNGLRIGPEGDLYVVSAFGSEVGAIGIDSGEMRIVADHNIGVATPDDLDFDSAGVLYMTECMDERVSAIQKGEFSVVADDLPGANGITIFEDRIFVTECRLQGRLLEVFTDDRPSKPLADGLELPNGMCVGPDRQIYFVLVYAGKIVRVPVDGGGVETFADGLEVPSSVRLGPDGWIWVTQGHTGEVTRVDPATGERETVATTRPGIDNLEISADGRLFLSYYIDGQVVEVLSGGGLRELVPPGLLSPYGIAFHDDALYVADGMKIATISASGEVVPGAKYTDEGFPGYLIGLASGAAGLHCTVSSGAVSIFDPETIESQVLAEGLSEPRGIALGEDGTAAVAEAGAGRVVDIAPDGSRDTVASGLGLPAGVAIDADGTRWVTDEDRGELLKIRDREATRVAGDLSHPQGVAVVDSRVFVLEAGAARLTVRSTDGGDGTVVAEGLPVGAGMDRVKPPLGGMPELLPGPLRPFAGVVAGPDGRILVSADRIGSVLTFEA